MLKSVKGRLVKSLTITNECLEAKKCFNHHNYSCEAGRKFGSLLGRVYSQNPAETVEKTAIDLMVQ